MIDTFHCIVEPGVLMEGAMLLDRLLPTRSEERGVLELRSIPVAILPSCQDMKTIAL